MLCRHRTFPSNASVLFSMKRAGFVLDCYDEGGEHANEALKFIKSIPVFTNEHGLWVVSK